MSLQNEETPHPLSNSQISKERNAARQSQLRPPPKQHFISPFCQLPLSPDERYSFLIHTQPLIPEQVYIPHVDDDATTVLLSTCLCQ